MRGAGGLHWCLGEWYFTTNNLYTPEARQQVTCKLLEAVPTSRAIQVRTPAYKQEYFGRATPLTREEAFSGTDVSRVGHHNDCFLSNEHDNGTYKDPNVDKAYLDQECLYVPTGGETCNPLPKGTPPTSSTAARAEMRYLRWSYLNADWYELVTDAWKADGGFDIIGRELGYRFELLSGVYFNRLHPGGIFAARIRLKNLGYAPPFNPRLVELILRNNQSGEKYRLRLKDADPRFWHPLGENTIEVTAGVPKDIATGNYSLFLNLPDPEPTLYANPAYSIRLANENVWEESTGYNNLNVQIAITADQKKR